MELNNLKSLLNKMTLNEKIGQLQQLTGDFFNEIESEITGPVAESGLSLETIQLSGSVLGLSGASSIKKLQREYLEKSRLKIPLLFMADIIHGYRTIFPIPLAAACSWNPELVKESARIAAKESTIAGLHVTFSPMGDLVRDPRWGRVMESTGEDPYLNQQYTKAAVEGYQGEDVTEDVYRLAACVKHFAAYGAPEGGREYNTVNMSDRQLRESYLPSYVAAIQAGCKLVMTAFNTIDGIPATGNRYLMRDILRKEIDFKGVLISDWSAVKELINHGVATDEKEAAYLSITAGVDIEMMTFCYQNFLKELIEEQLVPIELVDEAVFRILKLKNDLGLFEHPFRGADEKLESEWIYTEEPLNVAQQLAEESIVLLKNEKKVLPLNVSEKILVVGPLVNSGDLLGAWSWKGNPSETTTLQEAFSEIDQKIIFLPIADLWEVTAEEYQLIDTYIQTVDKVILTLGESSTMSGEAASRSCIQLPDAQQQLVHMISKYKKPVIAILINGRPLELSPIIESLDGVVEAWFPGSRGAQAIVNVLYGKINPTGKLTMSFPRNVGQVPIYYNHYRTGRPAQRDNDPTEYYVSKYLDVSNTPLYPFGYGLSYSEYQYEQLSIQKTILQKDDYIEASVEITNISDYAGIETVQWYIADLVGEVVRPVQELKFFEKIKLEPGEKKIAKLKLAVSECAYHHSNGDKKVDSGEFILMVGGNCQEVLQINFTVVDEGE